MSSKGGRVCVFHGVDSSAEMWPSRREVFHTVFVIDHCSQRDTKLASPLLFNILMNSTASYSTLTDE